MPHATRMPRALRAALVLQNACFWNEGNYAAHWCFKAPIEFSIKVFPSKFISAPFGGDKALEEKIQKDFGVTIRCIPKHQPTTVDSCLFKSQGSAKEVIFATDDS